MDYYTEPEANRAFEGAEKIVEFCRNKMPEDQLE